MPFVHLRVHSHYSLLSSSIDLEDLVAQAKAQGADAVALTDDGNLFGAIEFTQAAKAAGIRPILGCDLFVTRGSRHDRPEGAARPQAPDRLVVLCESEAGYHSLMNLVSIGYLEGLSDVPRVDEELLRRHHDGLIALVGGVDAEVAGLLKAGRRPEAEDAAARLRDIYGAKNLYLRLEDHGDPFERELNAFMAEIAPRLGVDLVVTTDCRFTKAEDLEAYRALWCIGAGATLDDPISRVGRPAQHVRSHEDIEATFADFPQAIAATMEIAERCSFVIPHEDPKLPDFSVPAGHTLDSYLKDITHAGFAERMKQKRSAAAVAIPEAEYRERLESELETISRMGFPGYFLVVWDLIRYAREKGIPVGPGRGSAAGSLVAYCLRITDLDPLEWGLLFERFLNPGRKSLPDIDMDFCQRRRGDVIKYVQDKYGEDHVAQIITFGTLSARSVIRDVGRVMNMSFGEVDRIAKLVPEELNITLAEALKTAPALEELRRTDPRVAKLMEIALSLEGLSRNAGVHAAGVIIAPSPLADLVPLFKTNKSETTTQYAMGGCESVGLVKMDFLGLKTLTVLDDAAESVGRASGGAKIRFEELPLDDRRTFDLFRQARTSGVFQFESSGMRDILRRLGPETLEDLIALNALYRPGPMQYIDSFISRRRGKEKVTYPHPLLENSLKPTFGIMVYQEQVMRASRELAGFSQSEADDLRKAMGKKKAEVMAAQKEKFTVGAVAMGVKQSVAADIFDAMEKFAGYAFNRAHSACYALVAYWSAWLKANHPAHFMAALLTSERDHTAKVVRYISECKEMGIEVLPPDVNESDVDFTVISDGAIRFGLSAIKGVGRGAVASILDARHRVGRFTSLHSFCSEIDLRLNNKKVLEALVKAGALDSLGDGRSTLMFSLDSACEAAASIRADRESGQASLFGGPAEPGPAAEPSASHALPRCPEWTREERLRSEKDVLGFYVSGHPLQEHAAALSSITSAQVAELAEFAGQEATVAGIVTSLRKTRTKKGDWMAFIQLEDLTGTVEILAFPKTWAVAQSFVTEDAALCVTGQVELDGDRGKILAETITPLAEARQGAASGLLIRLPGGLSRQALDDKLEKVGVILSASPGSCPVRFELAVGDVGLVTLQAAGTWAIDPEPSVVGDLDSVVGKGTVSLTFG